MKISHRSLQIKRNLYVVDCEWERREDEKKATVFLDPPPKSLPLPFEKGI
jgi:hypothetical protein